MGGDGGEDREPQPSARGDRVKLPRADWQKRQGMVPLLRALGAAEGETRFVGGCVRDTLLGIDVSDIDLATRLETGGVNERLKRANIKAVPTGLAHGTVTDGLQGGPGAVCQRSITGYTTRRRAYTAYNT